MRISIARCKTITSRVAVHDEGPGVTPEHAEKDFREVRHRRGPARSDVSLHRLGLAFCKLAIEAQGGMIGVEPGVPAGSTFWFELPA